MTAKGWSNDVGLFHYCSNIPNRSTFVCPFCGARNLDQQELVKHCMDNHRNDPNKVVRRKNEGILSRRRTKSQRLKRLDSVLGLKMFLVLCPAAVCCPSQPLVMWTLPLPGSSWLLLWQTEALVQFVAARIGSIFLFSLDVCSPPKKCEGCGISCGGFTSWLFLPRCTSTL